MSCGDTNFYFFLKNKICLFYLADIFSEHFDVWIFEQVIFELFNFVIIIKGPIIMSLEDMDIGQWFVLIKNMFIIYKNYQV